MPEYLSPGVYIEELPPQLRAIEGVSTSTAGFVGVTQRGPAPGFPLPFTPQPTDPQPVTLVPDPTPVLVTSFADFTRQFGSPLPLPDPLNNSYLGYAVQGFFSNGGLRAYIARVVHIDPTTPANSASYGGFGLTQGVVLPLATSVVISTTNPSTNTITFTALRGVQVGQSLSFYHQDGTPVIASGSALTATVQSYNSATGQITVSPSITVSLNAGDVYAVTTGTAPMQGPFFWARSPGAWSSQISVTVTPTRRRTVAITSPANPSATTIQVASTSGFYVGAIVEVDTGTQQAYGVVASIGSGSLTLTGALGVQVTLPTTPTGFVPTARITEIDITITDPSAVVPVTETYSGLTWNPDPSASVRPRHYSTAINAQSNLVYVEPPGVGTVNGTQFGGSETAAIGSQPTTFNGLAASISSLNTLFTGAVATLNAIGTAVQAVEQDLLKLTTAALPLTDPLLTQLSNDLNALKTTIGNAAAPVLGPAVGLSATIQSVIPHANDALTTATGALGVATTNPPPSSAATTLGTDHTTVLGDLTTINTAIGAAPSTTTSYVFGTDNNQDLTDDDYIGVDNGPGNRSGIQSLQDADDISIIAAPGQTDQTVQDELINQCELLLYRFAVIDGEQTPAGGSVNAILAHRQQYDTSYGAYYAPWFTITLNNQNLFLPPSGHIVGIYAGTDNSRGVWKAPANVVVQNITGLKYYMTKGEQDILNPVGVNLTRRFTATGTRVWGARTMSSDTSLMYVNVRRTLIFLEASIDQGTQWVVFEPNTPDTWDRLTDSVTAFLTTQWASGALFGAKPEDAFFVRCDETTMTADDIQNGRLICMIGVAIVRPAEFVIFRIEQITGYANQ